MPQSLKLNTFLGDKVLVVGFDINSNQCTILNEVTNSKYTISRSRILARDPEIVYCIQAYEAEINQIYRRQLQSALQEHTQRISNASSDEQIPLPRVRSEDGGSQSAQTGTRCLTRYTANFPPYDPDITNGEVGPDTGGR